jgi:hypothetical protein
MRKYWNSLLALAGGVALLGMGVAPASAAVSSCDTTAYFTGSTVTLQPESWSQTGVMVFSSPVTLTAYCGSVQPGNELSGVPINVYADSLTITDLKLSIDGSYPSQTAPIGLPMLQLTPASGGLVTDASGRATFTLRAVSESHPDLSGPQGSAQPLGLQFDLGTAPGSLTPVSWFGGLFGSGNVGAGGVIYAATPELDSLLLFGSGIASMAGYVVLRRRAAGRTRDE